ncbi:MAG: hypothetical protein ABIH23_11005, partial [bacterium]
KWNAKAGTLVKMVQASEFGGYTGERMDVCCDDSGNVFAMWADQASGSVQAVGRFFDPDLNPTTTSFIVFANEALGDNFTWKDVSCRMNADVVVASCHSDGLPDNDAAGAESLLEHVIRILENPFEAPASVEEAWELY